MDSQKFDLLMLELNHIKKQVDDISKTVHELEISHNILDTTFKTKMGFIGVASSAAVVAIAEIIRRIK